MSGVDKLVLKGEMKGHTGWVTAISTVVGKQDLVISASRDKSIIMWSLLRDDSTNQWGIAQKRLIGHNHFVQDVALSSDGSHAISASWDGSLRLWNLKTGESALRFVGHKKDVLTVAFSTDNRHIVSGSRDKTVKLWNTRGKCMRTFTKNGHTEWVSCVRISPNLNNPAVVSVGWDKLVKVWQLNANCDLKANLAGHKGFLNTVTISPDGSLCASGGKDGDVMLWDIVEGKHLSTLEAGEVINALTFSPVRYWLCAATASKIMIWDLMTKVCLDELKPLEPLVGKKAVPIQCVSVCWSADGSVLYAGYTDNIIRVFQVTKN